MNLDGWAWARLIVRWILGLIFLRAAIWKIFQVGLAQHADNLAVSGYGSTSVPGMLLTVMAYGMPFIELAVGIMLCAGLRAREALIVAGLLLVVTTVGHLIKEPLKGIQGYIYTRLALVVFLLMTKRGPDIFALDSWLERRTS